MARTLLLYTLSPSRARGIGCSHSGSMLVGSQPAGLGSALLSNRQVSAGASGHCTPPCPHTPPLTQYKHEYCACRLRALLLPYTFNLPAGQAAQAWIQLGGLGPSLFSNELFLQELQGATHLPVVGAGNPRDHQESGMTFILITCWMRYNSRRCAPGPVLPSFLPVLWVHVLKASSHKTCFFITYLFTF